MEDGKDEKETEEEITQVLPEESLDEEKGEVAAQAVGEDLRPRLKETEDKYLRAVADLDNFRKRVMREKEELALFTSEKLLKELLEVKDHLDMALSHAGNSSEVKGLREGVELTLKQMGKFLEKFGVEEINALGEVFNPAFHEAIHEEESAEYRAGMVVHVYQKGYLLNKRLLRAARVTVAKEKK